MITGFVTAEREAVLRLSVLGINGQTQETNAIVDTGYTGWLTLPPDLISVLGLRWTRLGRAILADGSTIITNVYDATILWDGHQQAVIVDEADSEPLIGMALMYGYELLLNVVDGGTFTLRDLVNR